VTGSQICDRVRIETEVTFSISKGACLVLFELLTKSYEEWRGVNQDDATANPMLVSAGRHSERVALWQIEGSIERTLPEVFSSNYNELLSAAHGMLSKY
jgi:hypothetical protein